MSFHRGWWWSASPSSYPASHSACLLPWKSSLAEVSQSLYFPTLHLHPVFPSCAGLLRWLPDADGGEAVLFIWPVLFREAVDVRIIKPFQTDCLSHWSVTSTDRAQGSVCVHAHVWGVGCDGLNQGNVQICPPSQQVQEQLIPRKALEAEVGVVSADFKCISFRVVSGAEKNTVNILPFSPQAPPPATFASPDFLHHWLKPFKMSSSLCWS